MRRRKHFLKTVCPFTVLEERVTWGEFIALYIKGLFGAVMFFAFYIVVVILADSMGAI